MYVRPLEYINKLTIYKTCIYDFVLYFLLQGLAQINEDVGNLATKAREGKLQPHEFQV